MHDNSDVQGVLKGFADQHRAVILCYGERAQLRRPNSAREQQTKSTGLHQPAA